MYLINEVINCRKITNILSARKITSIGAHSYPVTTGSFTPLCIVCK